MRDRRRGAGKRGRGLLLLALTLPAAPVHAQQSLPTISVGAASPIRRPVSTRPPATHQADARSRSESSAESSAAPSPAPDAVSTQATTAPDGALPIVADQFATVLVVPNSELRRSSGGQLGDVLFARPGVTGTEFAPGAASRPVVRGLDNYRVRIQENGLGASGASELGEDHAVPLDTLSVDQLEVVRGPATLRWGSQAIGGVVNATNNRIPETVPCPADATRSERRSGCTRLETRSAASTVDAGQEGAALADLGAGNFALHGDVTGRHGVNYLIPDYPYLYPPEPPPPVFGRQPNSSYRAGGGAIGGSVVGDNGYVGLAITQYDSLYRIPGIEPAETGARIHLQQTKVFGKSEIRADDGPIESLHLWGGVVDYKNRELADQNGYDGVQQTFANKSQEGRAELQFKPYDLTFAKLTAAVGVQGGAQRLTSAGVDGGLFDPNRTVNAAGFAFGEFEFTPDTRAQIAGRVENVHVTGSSPNLYAFLYPIDGCDIASVGADCAPAPSAPTEWRNRNFIPKSVALGLLQNIPGDFVVNLNGQYVERAPQAPELYSRGMHEATGTFDIGDPNLGIENAKSVEVGLKRALGPLRLEATAFYTAFGGFIYRNLTGQSCEASYRSCTPGGEGGDLRQAIYTQRDALFRGGEFQSQLETAQIYRGVFGVESQFDVVRATFAGGGNVPRIPPVRLGFGLFYRDQNWLARINLLHAFAQNHIAPSNETPTAGYELLKAEVSYKMKLDPAGRREMTLGASGNNLLNQNIRNSVSFRKDEVLLPGASIRLFATFVF